MKDILGLILLPLTIPLILIAPIAVQIKVAVEITKDWRKIIMKETIIIFILMILFLLFIGFLPAFIYCKINNAPQCTFARDPITCVQVNKMEGSIK